LVKMPQLGWRDGPALAPSCPFFCKTGHSFRNLGDWPVGALPHNRENMWGSAGR